jgi:hypothetical protein|tara:strand:+ start:609 stop:806 length:198 start_codon:yes stop_codon:yes gene_type:complete
MCSQDIFESPADSQDIFAELGASATLEALPRDKGDIFASEGLDKAANDNGNMFADTEVRPALDPQ